MSCSGNILFLCSPNNGRRIQESPTLGRLLSYFVRQPAQTPYTVKNTVAHFYSKELLVPCPTSELADCRFAWYRLHFWAVCTVVATYQL